MDNDAFRALIHKGNNENETKTKKDKGKSKSKSKNKTTKEIAREAVEQEFELKKKRTKRKTTNDDNNNYSSSSDNEDDQHTKNKKNNNDNNESSNKYIYRHGKKILKSNDGTYRDRAKERRKGLNIDYKDTSDLIQFATEDKDMSKFLGGDEKHTHLVKGLDLALADKVRRDQKNQFSKNIDHVDYTTPSLDFQNLPIQEFIVKMNSIKSQSSNHAQIILSYIISKLKHQTKVSQSNQSNTSTPTIITHQNQAQATQAIPISLAGYQIQKSTTTFTFESNIQHVSNAWEIPREYTISKASQTSNSLTKSNISSDIFIGCTSFDSKFLQMIQTSFDQYYISQTKQSSTLQNKHKNTDKSMKESIPISNKNKDKNKEDDDNDEDEDIFSGIGTYMPTLPSKKKDNTSIHKGSIFDGLITEDVEAPKTNEISKRSKIHTQTSTSILDVHKKPKIRHPKVIERDILGMGTKQKHVNKYAGKGVVISSYDGGYGEDMDCDFDGTLDNHLHTKKDSKKKKNLIDSSSMKNDNDNDNDGSNK